MTKPEVNLIFLIKVRKVILLFPNRPTLSFDPDNHVFMRMSKYQVLLSHFYFELLVPTMRKSISYCSFALFWDTHVMSKQHTKKVSILIKIRTYM